MKSLKHTALAVAGLGLSVVLVSNSAHAQFVCVDANGSTQGADASGSVDNTACGPSANASGVGSGNTATGNSANASGNGSSNIATGDGANASGDLGGNIATGNEAAAWGTNSRNMASGFRANASGDASSNIANGDRANAFGSISSNIANGLLANASGNNSSNIAVGAEANASGNGSSNVAIGDRASATGDGTRNTAVGAGSSANFANSSAFGAGATATRENQQVFGTASNTYTMSGITSGASRAAQSGPLQVVTTDANGNLASDGGRLFSDIAGLKNDVNRAFREIDKNTEGIAIAIAMGGLSLPDSKAFALSANFGFFDDKQAFAAQAAVRLNETLVMHGAVGTGFNGGGQTGARIGFQAAW